MELKRYRASGVHPVFGNRPGSVFEKAIPADQEARLLACGALELAAADAVIASPPPPAKPPRRKPRGTPRQQKGTT